MITQFKEELKVIGKSHLTVKAYVTDVHQFMHWLLDSIGHQTDVITETDLREYRQYLNHHLKLKASSINRKIKSVVQYQRFLITQGVQQDEVVLKKVLQKNNIELDYEVKVVEKHELYRLKRTIEAEGNKRDALVYYLLFGTGVRCSEMVSIELDDIHITDRNGKSNYSYIMIRNGKGDKIRKINLNSEVVNSIKAYLEVRPSVSSIKLLQGQRGTLTRLAINKLLEKYSKKAQLEYIVTPHMARHTFCSNLIKEGKVDPKTVAILSGHSSVDTLYRFYVNSSAEDKQRAVDNLYI